MRIWRKMLISDRVLARAIGDGRGHHRMCLGLVILLLFWLPSLSYAQTRRDSLDVMAAFGRRVELETAHHQYRLGIAESFLDEFGKAAGDRGPLASSALIAAATKAVARPVMVFPLVRDPTPAMIAERNRAFFSRLDRYYGIDSLQFAGDSAILWLYRFTEFHADSTADQADARYIFKQTDGTWQYDRAEFDKFTSIDRFLGPRRPRPQAPR